MKRILIINTYLNGGGAAIAAVRLAEALAERKEVEVAFLYLTQEGAEPQFKFEVQSFSHSATSKLINKINFVGERLQIFLHNGLNREKIFHISTALWGRDLSDHPLVKWADIIHLHWINQGMLSLDGLARIAKLKKIIWTLHDMWPISAVSPYLKNPNKYESPWSGKEKRLVEKVWQLKQEIYHSASFTFVGCSQWITNMAKESMLTKSCEIVSIPNPINQNLFKPSDSRVMNKFQILFGAVNTSDERKGFKDLVEALDLLEDQSFDFSRRYEIVTFGRLSKNAIAELERFHPIHHGYISSIDKMIKIYQNASCLVVPSLFDNLPNTIMESLACGTPVIAFKTGGIPEMIIDGETGYLAEYASPISLAEKINNMANLKSDQLTLMMKKARVFVEKNYSYHIVADRFINLYNKQ